jgi:hypothetical protein
VTWRPPGSQILLSLDLADSIYPKKLLAFSVGKEKWKIARVLTLGYLSKGSAPKEAADPYYQRYQSR